MKQLFSIIFAVIAIVSMVVFGFAWRQVQQQENALLLDLENRTRLLTESLKESVEPQFLSNSTASLQRVLDRFTNRQRLVGLVVFDNKGVKVASSQDLPEELTEDSQLAEQSMDADSDLNNFVDVTNGKFYAYLSPLHRDEEIAGALMLIQKVDYIDAALNDIWKRNFLRFLVQALVFSVFVILILRWIIYRPLIDLVKSIRLVRMGQIPSSSVTQRHAFFGPLISEISKMSRSLLYARSSAKEEARMRFEKVDTPWTAERLKEFMKVYLKDRKIFMVSNREPYIHTFEKNEIGYHMPASGMVTAIEPLMQACGGLWIAQGSGEADKKTVDKNNKVAVPPDDPKYTLKRIWLTEKEEKGFYVGFSNEALWPLCHMAHTRPIFRKNNWQEFKTVNGKFAESLLAEIKDVQRPLILIQDFHFSLLPRMIKKSRPDAQIGLFWHVPWPSAEAFSICPTRKEILIGMLGADVIGFHIQQYCNNFMETVSKEVESLVDMEQFSISYEGHISHIKPFPISIAFTNGKNGEQYETEESDIQYEYLGIGVDRLDYTKGILERFKGIEFFLQKYKQYQEKFIFIQIAAPSRESVNKYRQFNEDVTGEAERINEKFGRNGWKPIILLKKHFSHQEIYSFYRKANFCLVTSLHDGMNLVAKEYPAARYDEAGVLILSKFTGAARFLKDALIINPYSAESMAEAIYTALNMPLSEQHRRIKKMRDGIKDYNAYRWSAEFIKAVASLG